MDWQVIDLGGLAYAQALAVQRERNLAVSLGESPEALLLVEHEPVITLSNRKGVRDHLLASASELQRLGIDVQPTDRGGDITYHGPGQLVAYPIIRLNDHGLNLGRYMRTLEQAVIDTVATWGISASTERGATGVWVDTTPGRAKLCAMGVRIRKNTSMHGLALNVSTDLSHFQTIDPCGLGGRPVTSLQRLLGDRCPTMDEAKARLTACLAAAINSAAKERASA